MSNLVYDVPNNLLAMINDSNRGAYWINDIASLFPLKNDSLKDGNAIVPVGPPHDGYAIKTKIVNGKMNGKSIILNSYRVRIASLTFIDGVANGKCILYDELGNKYFKGWLKDGYRSGHGKEYDYDGNLIFVGMFEKGYRQWIGKEYDKNGVCTEYFFDRGVKQNDLVPFSAKSGYWKETSFEEDETMICPIDCYGNRYGIGYLYREERICKVSKWENGNEVDVMKEFDGNKMTEYSKGVIHYVGEFSDSLATDYCYNGEGIKYYADGCTVLYRGGFRRGKYHGNGVFYRNNRPVYNGVWFNGHRKWVLILRQWLVYCVAIGGAVWIMLFSISYGIPLLVIILWFIWKQYSRVWCGFDLLLTTHNIMKRNLFVRNDCCKLRTSFDLPPYRLKTVTIGDDCFSNVKKFVIEGLNELKSLEIGCSSFTGGGSDYESRSFQIIDCIELESIEIGRYSFSDYGGLFELKNLPKLSTIKIGEIGSDSSNFFYSSFVIKGIIDMILLMNRSSTFEFH